MKRLQEVQFPDLVPSQSNRKRKGRPDVDNSRDTVPHEEPEDDHKLKLVPEEEQEEDGTVEADAGQRRNRKNDDGVG